MVAAAVLAFATLAWPLMSRSFGYDEIFTTMKFVDADTMEWDWSEHMGLMKIMDMTGTARRQK